MSKQTTKDILESKLSLFAPGVDVAILDTMPGVLTAIYTAMHQYASPSPGWIKASERLPGVGIYHALYNGDHVLFQVHDGGFRVINYHGEKDDAPRLHLVKYKEDEPLPFAKPYINSISERLVYALNNWIVAHKEFDDGYRNEGGKITRLDIAALSTACNQADSSLRKAINECMANGLWLSEPPAKPEGEGLQWIKASDLKEKDPNREYIGKWRRGHVNNGRFSADGSSFFFDKYGQVDYMYYDHLFILVTGAAAHSPADSNTKKIKP